MAARLPTGAMPEPVDAELLVAERSVRGAAVIASSISSVPRRPSRGTLGGRPPADLERLVDAEAYRYERFGPSPGTEM